MMSIISDVSTGISPRIYMTVHRNVVVAEQGDNEEARALIERVPAACMSQKAPVVQGEYPVHVGEDWRDIEVGWWVKK